MGNILIIDDEVSFCRALEAVISEMGLGVETAHTLNDGLRRIRRGGCDVVVLDVVLPDGNGLDAIAEIREAPDQPEIIILTGSGDPDGAELAVKSGVWDYITKPPTMNKIRLPVSRAVEYHARKATRPPELCGATPSSAAARPWGPAWTWSPGRPKAPPTS
jgi:DNA-binding NtrC family response regulator